MIEAKAIAKHIKLSPRKARLVANEIRGYDVVEAFDILKFINKRAVTPIYKVIKSACQNAINKDEKIDPSKLYIKKIYVDEGARMKRFSPRARGRASKISKPLSHITVVVAEG